MRTYHAKVTSKGQITIPIEVRRELKLETGSPVRFTVRDDGRVEIESSLEAVRAVYGSLTFPPGVTPADVWERADEIGRADAMRHYRRSVEE